MKYSWKSSRVGRRDSRTDWTPRIHGYRCSLPGLAEFTAIGHPGPDCHSYPHELVIEEMAESQGFEPRVGCPTLDFESSAFDHSASSPREAR